MATDAQSLYSSASCYECFGHSSTQMQLLKLALLRQILLASNPNAVTDPQTLFNQANCYLCYANSPNQMQLLELALLAQIVSGGGGSGGLSSGGVTNPALIPAPSNKTIVNGYFSDPKVGGNGNVYWWTPAANAWQ